MKKVKLKNNFLRQVLKALFIPLLFFLPFMPAILITSDKKFLNNLAETLFGLGKYKEIQMAKGIVESLGLPYTTKYIQDLCIAPFEDYMDIDLFGIGSCRFDNSVGTGYLVHGKIYGGDTPYHVRGFFFDKEKGKYTLVEKTCPVEVPSCNFKQVIGVLEVENYKIKKIYLADNLSEDDKEALSKFIFYTVGLQSYRRGEFSEQLLIFCNVSFPIQMLSVKPMVFLLPIALANAIFFFFRKLKIKLKKP